MKFTLKHTLNEILSESRPELNLFFPKGMLPFVPEEHRNESLQELMENVTMPWGIPFPAEDLLYEANLVAEADKNWKLIPLWTKKLTVETNDQNSVCLMVPVSKLEGIRPAVIICPGGGYEFLSFDYEGIRTAKRMEEVGYRTFILNYRVSPNRYPDPQSDLALAIKHVRANAKQYQIDPNDLMILGYSAGGHLCASTAALREELDDIVMKKLRELRPELAGVYQGISVRPDKICLSYPVISFLSEAHEPSFQQLTGGEEALREKLSVEKHIDREYPKTFVWTCADDSLVPPSNAVRMGRALEEQKIPYRLEVYPQGEHGCSLGEGTSAAGWVDEMLRFI